MELTAGNFVIAVTETADAAVVSAAGELDMATAPLLREEFAGLVQRGIFAVTLDMAGIGFIDSSGLGALVTAMKRLREHGGDLTLKNPSPAAWKVFELTGLTEVFVVLDHLAPAAILN